MTAISRRETPGFSQVLVCTAASHRCAGLELLEASCERVGIGLTIFGLGDTYENSRFKVRALRAGLETIGDDYELVLMVDAFDSLFVRGLDSILNQWQRLNAPIVFSAERNCHPPDGPRPEDYPPAPNDYRFLNSGGILGEVKTVCRTLETFDVPERWVLPDDQGFWARLYITGAAPIVLDHQCRIFQCQWIAEQDLRLGTEIRRRKGPHGSAARSRWRTRLPWPQLDPLIRNRATGGVPSIFHANGFCDIRPFARHILGIGPTSEILGPAEQPGLLPIAGAAFDGFSSRLRRWLGSVLRRRRPVSRDP